MGANHVTGFVIAAAAVIGSQFLSISIWAQSQSVADQILVNGKILTVDQNFSVVQALAIKGERITASGTDEAINKLAGAGTKVLDLKGRTVIPGLIDNHFHLIRGAANWSSEARIDLVTTHKEALKII